MLTWLRTGSCRRPTRWGGFITGLVWRINEGKLGFSKSTDWIFFFLLLRPETTRLLGCLWWSSFSQETLTPFLSARLQHQNTKSQERKEGKKQQQRGKRKKTKHRDLWGFLFQWRSFVFFFFFFCCTLFCETRSRHAGSAFTFCTYFHFKIVLKKKKEIVIVTGWRTGKLPVSTGDLFPSTASLFVLPGSLFIILEKKKFAKTFDCVHEMFLR